MTIRERIMIIKEIETRNQKRIKDFISQARKHRFRGALKKTDEYMDNGKKHK